MRLNVKMEIPGKEPREFLYEFDQPIVTMGRDSKNDIQIPLTTVSRQHAQIIQEGGEYFIEDLRSTHGTTHNAKPLGMGGKKLLRDGDTVAIMHFRIAFQRVADKPMEFASSERTEQLARRMVQEVLASIGDSNDPPYLRVMNGPDEGKRFELTDAIAEVVIGRGNDCDLVINDANISRRHAVVRKDWSGITIEDLGSKNGVVINEKRIEGTAAIKDRDEIMLGAVRLTFIDPTASMLGNLDGIPAFEVQETIAADGLKDDAEESDAEADEESDAESEEHDGEEEHDPSPSGESSQPDMAAPHDDGDEADKADDDDEAKDEEAEEGDEAAPTGSVGKTEIIVLVLVILLVLGLGGGLVAFLLL